MEKVTVISPPPSGTSEIEDVVIELTGVSKWTMVPIILISGLALYLNSLELGMLFYLTIVIGLSLSGFVGYAAQEYPHRTLRIASDYIKISTKEKRRTITPIEIKNIHIGVNRMVIITDTKNAIIPFSMVSKSKKERIRTSIKAFCDRNNVLLLN